MPVHEIKNPAPPPPVPRETPATGTPLVEGVPPLARIRHLRREWKRLRYGAPPPAPAEPGEEAERALRQLIDTVNEDFAAHKVPLHISLVREGEGYLLDIYDCSGSEACRLVADRELPLDRIPEVLRGLQQELGILVDRRV